MHHSGLYQDALAVLSAYEQRSDHYLQLCAHVVIYIYVSDEGPRINGMQSLPSNSSHTTSPVQGEITTIAIKTRSSAPIPPRGSSTKHIMGGAELGSNSSVVFKSSTKLHIGNEIRLLQDRRTARLTLQRCTYE